MRSSKNFTLHFLAEGVVLNFKIRGSKKYIKAVYNSDYIPLSKIGGWVFTKISKSKSQKFPYHLHHATISRFTQPHSTISLTSFFNNPTPSNHPLFPPHIPSIFPTSQPQIHPKSPQLTIPKISSPPPWVSPKIHSNPL